MHLSMNRKYKYVCLRMISIIQQYILTAIILGMQLILYPQDKL